MSETNVLRDEIAARGAKWDGIDNQQVTRWQCDLGKPCHATEVDDGIILSVSGLTGEQAAAMTLDFGTMRERMHKLEVLCRDMYLVTELVGLREMRLQAHGKDADWNTMRERMSALGLLGE